MKITFKVATADKLNAAIMMENQPFKVLEISAWCNGDPVAVDDGVNTTFLLNISKTVQNAGVYAAGAFTSSNNLEILENDGIETFSNLQRVTVVKFNRGVSYLVNKSAPAALPMIPSFDTIPLIGTTTVLTATHYAYDCDTERSILGQTSITDCITREVNGAMVAQRDTIKAQRKASEIVNFGAAVGDPAAMAIIERA